ncbi:26S proteasome non-ATPase regulatory subunit 9 [Cinnamomum micranthum f. kanehirae]|uniref:26S proteasome non-ATPase regulatory subunit 9 n=1 Tax=Cinnamomum micranthum f. kanehirae TaxID=337451 RepID=A0A443PKA1_9MAGN|nr:26S proteasome non-ATPase regulatory subunit 9 [Cinnamomum micranthum f. kanehirae]
MVATNLKLGTISLMEKRDEIEAEMNSIISRLSQPGGPGISGNLLDSEGFPRSDIDISSVRSDRHRLSELRNDYKDLTDKINENLLLLHSARRSQNVALPIKDAEGSNNSEFLHSDGSTSVSSRDGIPEDSPTSMEVEPIVMVPFAIVDEIAEASPAAEDGLQLGDQIVKFGNTMAWSRSVRVPFPNLMSGSLSTLNKQGTAHNHLATHGQRQHTQMFSPCLSLIVVLEGDSAALCKISLFLLT